jgi:hypothetical protein
MKKIMFLTMFIALLTAPMASYAETVEESELVTSSENPVLLASFRCGSGTCEDGQSCCGDGRCCPKGKNIYCSSSRLCYSSIAAAKADCGDNYTICASPAE